MDFFGFGNRARETVTRTTLPPDHDRPLLTNTRAITKVLGPLVTRQILMSDFTLSMKAARPTSAPFRYDLHNRFWEPQGVRIWFGGVAHRWEELSRRQRMLLFILAACTTTSFYAFKIGKRRYRRIMHVPLAAKNENDDLVEKCRHDGRLNEVGIVECTKASGDGNDNTDSEVHEQRDEDIEGEDGDDESEDGTISTGDENKVDDESSQTNLGDLQTKVDGTIEQPAGDSPSNAQAVSQETLTSEGTKLPLNIKPETMGEEQEISEQHTIGSTPDAPPHDESIKPQPPAPRRSSRIQAQGLAHPQSPANEGHTSQRQRPKKAQRQTRPSHAVRGTHLNRKVPAKRG